MTLHDYKLICPSYLMLNKGEVCERCINGNLFNCLLSKCHKGQLSASLVLTMETYFNMKLRKYDAVDYFICPSRFLARKLLEAGWPEEKLVHIPNSINVDVIKPNYGTDGYILFVGRLSREKGVLTLLDAVKGLDADLRLVGDGPMRADYEKYALDNNISNAVFEGYKSGEELKDIFRNAAFIVMPSEWYENAPITILEAFAYGKPVIGSKIGGIPELVIEGETGMLYRTCRSEDLKEKIRSLLADPTATERMGRNARTMVEDRHSAQVHYEKLMEAYKRALK